MLRLNRIVSDKRPEYRTAQLITEARKLDGIIGSFGEDTYNCRNLYLIVHILDYIWIPEHAGTLCASVSNKDFRYHFSEGDASFVLGDMNAALFSWQRGLLIQTGFPYEQIVHIQTSSIEESLRTYGSRSIPWEGVEGMSYFLRATFYLINFSEVIPNDPLWADRIQTEQGERYLSNAEKSLFLLEKAVGQAPENWRLNTLLGDVHARLGKLDTARGYWRIAQDHITSPQISERIESASPSALIENQYQKK